MIINTKLVVVFLIVLSVGVYLFIRNVAEKDIPTGGPVNPVSQTVNGEVSSGDTANSSTGSPAEKKQAIADIPTSEVLHTKGEVVSIDIAGKKITYKPYMFASVGKDEKSLTFAENIPVYRVDDETKINSTDARIAVTLADIQPGQIVFIGLENEPLQTGQFVPNEFVIVSGK